MTRTTVLLAAIIFYAGNCVYADYTVEDQGKWPNSWPKELEPLRKQSRTFEGPLLPQLHYGIPFTKRDEFESAWPHLLKVKSQGAPIILRRGPNFWLENSKSAGVCIHTPPAETDQREKPRAPAAGVKSSKEHWGWNSTYIELIVDGEIVDLNRIPLPADTPIIDERFKDDKKN